MSKRTVLKVDTSCVKCKRKVLQAVSGLQGSSGSPLLQTLRFSCTKHNSVQYYTGFDKIEIDSEKSTMTVTGSVDPVDVIVQTRKAGKRADVVTIRPPSKLEEKKLPKQQQQEIKYSAATEQKAPVPPVTVYVQPTSRIPHPAPSCNSSSDTSMNPINR